MSDLNRLANPSFGFVAVDGGIGYTYLDRRPETNSLWSAA